MKLILRTVPNTITLLNLLAGCMSVMLALHGQTLAAVYCLFAAAVFDFCDGLSARLLHAFSSMGKELDSLADMVSFGVAPAVLLHLWMVTLVYESGVYEKVSGGIGWELLVFAPFVVTLCSALRLAKFNVDDRQTDRFIGLPTPANALLLASLVCLQWPANVYLLLGICAVSAFLLVCGLPMFSVKFKNLRWRDNRLPFSFLLYCLAAVCGTVATGQHLLLAAVLIFGGYILLSLVLFIVKHFNSVKK